MKCKDVQEKLPEYLAGILDENTKTQVDSHLKTCNECSTELKELNKDIVSDISQVNDVNEKRILKKTKVKFNLAIIRTVVVIAGVMLLISMLPTFLWGIQSVLSQSKASRALMDVVQFSQPNKVNMWGNSAVESLSLSVPLKIGARPVIGRNYREQLEYIGRMSVVSGKVSVPEFLGASFVHPDLFIGIDFGRDKNVEVQTKKLEKNAETSVSVVDYSLNKTISLSEVESIINKYDVEVCWMAVEAGIEDAEPRNMSFGDQQVLQWGIPGKLSKPGDFDYAQLQKGNSKDFERSIIEELKWLDDNKTILKPDSDLLKSNGIDNSVNEQIQYILQNGIKIYGLRITGPSSEIIKLTQALDIRTMSVVDMDFWNW